MSAKNKSPISNTDEHHRLINELCRLIDPNTNLSAFHRDLGHLSVQQIARIIAGQGCPFLSLSPEVWRGIQIASELGLMLWEPPKSHRINSSHQAYAELYDVGFFSQECVYGLFLDSQNQLVERKEFYRGTVSGCTVSTAEIVKCALLTNASKVIVAHNHPSSVVCLSEEDTLFTKRLSEALELMDIVLLDHLVLGMGQFFSAADEGKMDFKRPLKKRPASWNSTSLQ